MNFTDIKESDRVEVISKRPDLKYLFDLVDECDCETSFEILATDKDRMRYIIDYAIRKNQFKRIGKDKVGMPLEEYPHGKSAGFNAHPERFSEKLNVRGTYWIDRRGGQIWRFTRIDGEWWFFNGLSYCAPRDIVRKIVGSTNTFEHGIYSDMTFRRAVNQFDKSRAIAASVINQAATDSVAKCASLIKPTGVHFYEMPQRILPLARLFRAVSLMLAEMEKQTKKQNKDEQSKEN